MLDFQNHNYVFLIKTIILQKDVFKIEAVTLMALKKIVIGHDAKNPGSGWFLDKVIVKQEGNSNGREAQELFPNIVLGILH
jgi:hypothetical protein